MGIRAVGLFGVSPPVRRSRSTGIPVFTPVGEDDPNPFSDLLDGSPNHATDGPYP